MKGAMRLVLVGADVVEVEEELENAVFVELGDGINSVSGESCLDEVALLACPSV